MCGEPFDVVTLALVRPVERSVKRVGIMAFTATRTAFKAVQRPSSVSSAPVRTSVNVQRASVQANTFAAGVGILGTKAGMMSYFTPEGLCVPATVIALEEGNVVTAIKTDETDGYNAVQVGYKVVPERKMTKPELGHLKKSGCPPLKHLIEFRLKDKSVVTSYTPGQELSVSDMFKEGEKVDVAGTSIGKGFQGTVKRWGHHRGFMTHGSKSHREHGSMGAGTTPGRVFPGLKQAGHMGNERITIRAQQILKIDSVRKAIVVKGCVPGKPGSIVEVRVAKVVGKNC
ncbi:hypothetical protein QJQ45_020858 [Haematococcus lacustris]|nr:hypothetical protein QJQ45_020858 [Haematococcus lacustris]